MLTRSLFPSLLVAGFGFAAVLNRETDDGSLDVVIPNNRRDDQFYNVRLSCS